VTCTAGERSELSTDLTITIFIISSIILLAEYLKGVTQITAQSK